MEVTASLTGNSSRHLVGTHREGAVLNTRADLCLTSYNDDTVTSSIRKYQVCQSNYRVSSLRIQLLKKTKTRSRNYFLFAVYNFLQFIIGLVFYVYQETEESVLIGQRGQGLYKPAKPPWRPACSNRQWDDSRKASDLSLDKQLHCFTKTSTSSSLWHHRPASCCWVSWSLSVQTAHERHTVRLTNLN